MSFKPKVAREFLYPVKSDGRDMGGTVVNVDNCDPEYRNLSLEINHNGAQVRFSFHFDGYSKEERNREIHEAQQVMRNLGIAINRLATSLPEPEEVISD